MIVPISMRNFILVMFAETKLDRFLNPQSKDLLEKLR
jgi:hypothetical protein